MANKTLQFYGTGYGDTPVTISATFDGMTVFNGTIPTVAGPIPTISREIAQVSTPLFTVDLPLDFIGSKSLAITVTGGTAAAFGRVMHNNALQINPAYSDAQNATLIDTTVPWADKAAIIASVANPAFSAEELTLVESTNPADVPARKALLASRGLSLFNSSGDTGFVPFAGIDNFDTRQNIVFDGTPVTDTDSRALMVYITETNAPTASRVWVVPTGSPMVCDIVVPDGSIIV